MRTSQLSYCKGVIKENRIAVAVILAPAGQAMRPEQGGKWSLTEDSKLTDHSAI